MGKHIWPAVLGDNFVEKKGKSQESISLQCRHNERDGVFNHRHLECLLNRLFRYRSKKPSKLCVTGAETPAVVMALILYNWLVPVFHRSGLSQMENENTISLWWRHQMETFSALLASVRRIYRSLVNSPHKGQWHRAGMFFFWSAVWINGWVNSREAGDLRRHGAHYDVIVMLFP